MGFDETPNRVGLKVCSRGLGLMCKNVNRCYKDTIKALLVDKYVPLTIQQPHNMREVVAALYAHPINPGCNLLAAPIRLPLPGESPQDVLQMLTFIYWYVHSIVTIHYPDLRGFAICGGLLPFYASNWMGGLAAAVSCRFL